MNYSRLVNIYKHKWVSLINVKIWQYLYIYENVWDANNQKIFKFKCLVIKIKNPNQIDWTFTVRWKIWWIDIEKIYPLSFQKFDKIELLDEYKVRKSKLYYIRWKVWKKSRLKSKWIADKKWTNIVENIKKFEKNVEIKNE